MTFQRRRYYWLTIWLVLVLSAPITVIINTPISSLNNSEAVITLFQRISGLLAFTFIFYQIILGAFMKYWVQTIGSKAYWFHRVQGIMTYALAFVHPVMDSVLKYQLFGKLEPFLLPGPPSIREAWLTVGRIAFVLVTLSGLSAYFQTRSFLRRRWRMFHRVNYPAFYLIASHAWFVGTDIRSFPFSIVFWLAVIFVFLAPARSYLWRHGLERGVKFVLRGRFYDIISSPHKYPCITPGKN